MNNLPFYPLALADSVWHIPRQCDVGYDALCGADAHHRHWFCAAAGPPMARFTAACVSACTLGSLPLTRGGLPARARDAGESVASPPESSANSAASGRDAGYVRQYGFIRARQTESSAASQELSTQWRAFHPGSAGAALSAQAVPV